MRTDRKSYDSPGDQSSWVQWRSLRLRRAGFPSGLAERVARDGQLDLHELLELVDRGCPPHLAVRILAPLDQAPES